jgi:hypothetical protein
VNRYDGRVGEIIKWKAGIAVFLRRSILVHGQSIVVTRICDSAFSRSPLRRLAIPQSVEVIGENCFSFCNWLTHVVFEADSELKRIEAFAFRLSGLKQFSIARGIEIVHESALIELECLWLEPGGNRFSLEDVVLSAVESRTQIRHFGPSSGFVVPSHILNLEPFCLACCRGLRS